MLSSDTVAPLSTAPSTIATARASPFAARNVVGTTPVSTVATTTPSSGGWDGSKPLTCTGADEVTVSGVTATLPESIVISAIGGCKLHLTHVHITGRTGLYVGGGAQVTVEDSTIEGTVASIDYGGNAHVRVHATTVVGPIRRAGHATLERD